MPGRGADEAFSAVTAAGGVANGVRAEIRRTALIEFEVSRRPELSNGTIARACRCAPSRLSYAFGTDVGLKLPHLLVFLLFFVLSAR